MKNKIKIKKFKKLFKTRNNKSKYKSLTYKPTTCKQLTYKTRTHKRFKGGEVLTPTNKPSLTSRALGVTAQLAKSAAELYITTLINIAGNALGINTNKSVGEVVMEISKEINSEKNRQILSQIGQDGVKIIKSLEPAIQEAQNEINKLMSIEAKAMEKTALDMVGVVPVIGEVVEGVRVVGDVTHAAEKLAETTAKLTGIGSDAILAAKTAYNDVQSNISSGINKLDNTATNMANKATDAATNMVNKTTDTATNMANTATDTATNMANKATDAVSNQAVNAANIQKPTLSALQKGGKKTIQRTNESINNFLPNSSIFKTKN